MNKKDNTVGASAKDRLVQLDYFTGEYLDTYPGVAEAAEDYDIDAYTITRAFKVDGCAIAKISKYKLLFMTEETYKIIASRRM